MAVQLVAGLAFGDEGKGSIVDALVRHSGADLVVRYNGGAQAAHNVVTPEGQHHTFAQFGSGSFVPGVRTYLSKHVLINPMSMLVEAEDLKDTGVTDILSRTSIDARAFVITPYHRALNRLEEISRGTNPHGSTGMGIGKTREYSLEYGDAMITVGDILNPKRLENKLAFIRSLALARLESLDLRVILTKTQREIDTIKDHGNVALYLEIYDRWAKQVHVTPEPLSSKNMVFEGAQGMLLDETWGFQPHTTWTDITFKNAEDILNEIGYNDEVSKIGVLRTYFTRHGAGPFPSESNWISHSLPECHNAEGPYTGPFRYGYFDVSGALYALQAIGGVDSLAVNHLDKALTFERNIGGIPVRMSKSVVSNYTRDQFLDVLEHLTHTSISIRGYGQMHTNKLILQDKLCLSSGFGSVVTPTSSLVRQRASMTNSTLQSV